jgi:hypothetical protein
MAANMSDKEEDAAARRKREQDPDPNRSGAPINVPTEGKRKMKEETFDEACWTGYEKKGMKTMFGKRYPNCVKKESIDVHLKIKKLKYMLLNWVQFNTYYSKVKLRSSFFYLKKLLAKYS